MLRALFHPGRMYTVTVEFLKTLFRNRALLVEQVRRDLFEAHAGQVIGGLWSVLHPLSIMLIYAFVFTFVFQNRIGGTYELPLDYTSYILSGLAPWMAMVQALSKTSNALTANANLIKQVVFPIEVLPIKAALSSIVPLIVMLAVYFIYTVGFQQQFLWTQLLLPVLVFIFALWAMGIGLFLASSSVYVRDVREFVQIFAVAGVFILPVIYLPTWVPAIFKPFLYINPFSYIIWCFQDALYFGRFEHPWAWVVSLIGGVIVFGLGARTFIGLKPYFGDAL